MVKPETTQQEADRLQPYFQHALYKLGELLNNKDFTEGVRGVAYERMLTVGAQYEGSLFEKTQEELLRDAAEEVADYIVYTARLLEMIHGEARNSEQEERGVVAAHAGQPDEAASSTHQD